MYNQKRGEKRKWRTTHIGQQYNLFLYKIFLYICKTLTRSMQAMTDFEIIRWNKYFSFFMMATKKRFFLFIIADGTSNSSTSVSSLRTGKGEWAIYWWRRLKCANNPHCILIFSYQYKMMSMKAILSIFIEKKEQRKKATHCFLLNEANNKNLKNFPPKIYLLGALFFAQSAINHLSKLSGTEKIT